MLPLRAPTPGACLRRAGRARGRPPALTPWQRPADSPPLRGRDGAGPSACPLPGPSAPLPCSPPASPRPCHRSPGVTDGATSRGFAPRPGSVLPPQKFPLREGQGATPQPSSPSISSSWHAAPARALRPCPFQAFVPSTSERFCCFCASFLIPISLPPGCYIHLSPS